MADEDELDSEESSLAEFEEQYLNQQKKAKTSRIIFISLLIAIAVGGYVAMEKGLLDDYIFKSPKLDTAAPPPPPETESGDFIDEVEFMDEPPESIETDIPVETAKVEETAKAPEKEIKKEEPKKAPPVQEATQQPAPKPAPVKEKRIVKPGKVKAGAGQSGRYALQVGAYSNEANAEARVKKLKELGLNPVTEKSRIGAHRIEVVAGRYPFRELAMDAAKSLLNKGYHPVVKLTEPGNYSLMMGTYYSHEDARQLIKELEDKGILTSIKKKKIDVDGTVVLIRDINGLDQLAKIQEILNKSKIKYFLKK